MPITVVSGADRNIGLEIVKQFLQRGWKVFAGRYLMELPLLEELQEKYPQQLTLVPLDVSDEELAARKAKWQPREPKVTTGYLARYASMVTSGNRGAILQIPGTGEEK